MFVYYRLPYSFSPLYGLGFLCTMRNIYAKEMTSETDVQDKRPVVHHQSRVRLRQVVSRRSFGLLKRSQLTTDGLTMQLSRNGTAAMSRTSGRQGDRMLMRMMWFKKTKRCGYQIYTDAWHGCQPQIMHSHYLIIDSRVKIYIYIH